MSFWRGCCGCGGGPWRRQPDRAAAGAGAARLSRAKAALARSTFVDAAFARCQRGGRPPVRCVSGPAARAPTASAARPQGDRRRRRTRCSTTCRAVASGPSVSSAVRTWSRRSSRCARYARAAVGASGSSGPWPGSTTVPSAQVREAAQRREVGPQLAVRVGDHGRAAAEHGVARQHRRTRPHRARRAGTTASPTCAPAWRAPAAHTPRPPPRHPRRAPRSPAPASGPVPGPALRSARRGGGRRRAWSRWRWVSRISATGPRAATLSRWATSSSPGSTTTHSRSPGARNSQVFVPSNVIGDGLGSSSTDASGVTVRGTPYAGCSTCGQSVASCLVRSVRPGPLRVPFAVAKRS